MEHIAAILLLIGCSDDLVECRELPAPVPVYETLVECEEDLESSMRGFTGEYPQILGQCFGVDPAAENEDAELVWSISPDGNLLAGLEQPEIQIASTRLSANVEQE